MATGSAAGEESSAAARRLRRLSLHLLQPAPAPADRHQQPLALAACARRVEGGADVAAALAAYLRGRHRAAQMRLFDFFRARPDLQTPVELPTAAHRELCYRQLRALVREAGVRPLTLMATDPAEYFAVMEAAGGADISLGVKLGVQYRSVASRIARLRDILSSSLLCFCRVACMLQLIGDDSRLRVFHVGR
jgi:acyl-CoA oxidase